LTEGKGRKEERLELQTKNFKKKKTKYKEMVQGLDHDVTTRRKEFSFCLVANARGLRCDGWEDKGRNKKKA